MISHADCDHPSTSGARAKCRRARELGMVHTEESGSAVARQAKVMEMPDDERNRGTTPRDRDKQCDICGIEKIEFKGRNRYLAGAGLTIMVGEKCHYYLDPEQSIIALP